MKTPQTWEKTPLAQRKRVLVMLRVEASDHRWMGKNAAMYGEAASARHHARREAAFRAAAQFLAAAAPKPKRRTKP